MASETIEYIASFVIIITVITGGILNATQSLGNAFNYDIDQASSNKAKDTLMSIIENTGSPYDWTITGAQPDVFGLKWPNFAISTPSPYGIARMLEPNASLTYGSNSYKDLSRDDFSLYLDENVCLEYSDLKNLIDPNGRYGLQLSFKPVLNITSSFTEPTLRVNVKSASVPLVNATVTISVFYTDVYGAHPLTIERFDRSEKTINGDCSFDLSGASRPFFVYIKADYSDLSSSSYFVGGNLDESAIIPIVTNYEAAEVSLVHRKDVGLFSSYSFSGDIYYNATIAIPLTEQIFRSTPPVSGDVSFEDPPPKISLASFKSTPSILLIFYERSFPSSLDNDYGITLMPWGVNTLGLSTTFGPEPSHVVNVVTQSVISNIGDVTYVSEIKLWRDIVSTETVSGLLNVTVTSNPAGDGFVVVDGNIVTTPHKFQWELGSTHSVEATPVLAASPGTRYQFVGWNDGKSRSHTYLVTGSSTLQAFFKTQYEVSIVTNSTDGGVVTARFTNGTDADLTPTYYDAGQELNVTASPNMDYGFHAWTSTNPATIFSVQEPSSIVTIGGPGIVVANFIHGVISVTITSSYLGSGFILVDGDPITTPHTFNWINGDHHQIEAKSPISLDSNTRYAYVSWSDSGTQSHEYIVSVPSTVTASYVTQYKVNFVASGLDSDLTGTVLNVGGLTLTNSSYSKWFNSGSTVVYTYSDPVVSSVSGKQYKLSHTTGPSSGSTISAPATISCTYITQYLVSFNVNPLGYGSTNPTGTNLWLNRGTLIISATPTTGHVFSQWTSSGYSYPFAGYNISTTTTTISGSGIITANFANGPVDVLVTSSPEGDGFVLVDGLAITTPHTFQWEVGSDHTLSTNSPVPGEIGSQYVYSGWSDAGGQTHNYHVSTAATVIANFRTQYKWKFTASGLDGTVTPSTVIVTVGSTPITYSGLGVAAWYDSSTPYTYTATAPSTTPEKRFSYNAPSTATPPSGGNDFWIVTANYVTQYTVTYGVNNSHGDVIPSGTYWENSGAVINIIATPKNNKTFLNWSSTGGITIANPGSASTTATINGPGTITGNFSN